MYGSKFIDCLNLDYNFSTDREIQNAFTDQHAFIINVVLRFPFERDILFLQFNFQRIAVNTFRKPRTQFSMNRNRRADDSPNQNIKMRFRFSQYRRQVIAEPWLHPFVFLLALLAVQ